MPEYFINVQCKPEGKLIPKSFIAEGNTLIPISPEFDDLIGVYRWMRDNKWEANEWDGQKMIPWRVKKS